MCGNRLSRRKRNLLLKRLFVALAEYAAQEKAEKKAQTMFPDRCPACDDELGSMLLRVIAEALSTPSPAVCQAMLILGTTEAINRFAEKRQWVFRSLEPPAPSHSEIKSRLAQILGE